MDAAEPSIIVAEDLAPSETVQMDKSKVLAFVTRKGSSNSHTAILARTMNIPALINIEYDESMDGKMAVCTVIGFPNGNTTTATKEFETKDAIANGASEIDMVINIGWLKDKKYDLIENEIRTLKAACGEKILKVIIETCFLTTEEKIKMCEIVTAAGADYIKTSTGFGGGGATFEDIELFSKHIGPNVKMKAAGGISSLDDAEKFLSLGADRLGTSRIIKIVKNEETTGY